MEAKRVQHRAENCTKCVASTQCFRVALPFMYSGPAGPPKFACAEDAEIVRNGLSATASKLSVRILRPMQLPSITFQRISFFPLGGTHTSSMYQFTRRPQQQKVSLNIFSVDLMSHFVRRKVLVRGRPRRSMLQSPRSSFTPRYAWNREPDGGSLSACHCSPSGAEGIRSQQPA